MPCGRWTWEGGYGGGRQYAVIKYGEAVWDMVVVVMLGLGYGGGRCMVGVMLDVGC